MKLSEKLAGVGSGRQQHQCTVGQFLASLDKGEAEAVREIIMDQNRVAAQLSAVLREEGHNVGPDVLRRHRRGECCCK